MIKHIFLILILLLLYCKTEAQVSGTIKDQKGKPLVFASVVVKGQNTGTATDTLGLFHIDAQLGDTILIYHLNVGCQEHVINSSPSTIILNKKNHSLTEIEVSNNFAFKLFDSCRLNTYKKLRNQYNLRAYWRGIETSNNDTLQLVDIDFDVCQEKLRKIGKEAVINLKKIQERKLVRPATSKILKQFDFQSRVKPFENNFLIYKNFNEDYIYKIRENDDNLILSFAPKRKIKKAYNNIEVAIRKNDFCIDYISSCTAKNKQIYAQEKSVSKNITRTNIEVALFLKYSYTKDFCYLSYYEMIKTFLVSSDEGVSNRMNHKSAYQVYNPEIKNCDLRTGKNIMRYSILDKAENNYIDKFWKNPQFIKQPPIDYGKLKIINE
ncbi:carboxypeptidase-like regulatory domain-containing protein [Ancylomarina sp. 16SWW S1-10-2]|uniref:carboxypeptidase-like regulatory domain-containing protein n=1 Tax=Ancylomarina sp. 16SWW S1-10-2 TaxID=2499681 RepID=UPI0012AE760F|nr:carboxypeptidase-like regulatory domain-containing protein [Ancylomarina sp. 16SWW S1-10-2]MRT92120.1 hypothetical protein [Ancylomarina sp. 16SWW S1-10-2]